MHVPFTLAEPVVEVLAGLACEGQQHVRVRLGEVRQHLGGITKHIGA